MTKVYFWLCAYIIIYELYYLLNEWVDIFVRSDIQDDLKDSELAKMNVLQITVFYVQC